MDQERFSKEIEYVYNIAYKLTLNKFDSEDLAQETLIRAWEKENSLKNPDARNAWLKRICINLFYMKIRKIKGYKELPIHETYNDDYKDYIMQIRDKSPSLDKEVLAMEEVKIIRDHCFLGMTQKLTLHQRIIYMTVDIFGLTLKDASELIGISEAAAKAQLYRGRKNLYQFFSQKCGWINFESTCQCEAYLEAQQDIYDKQESIKLPDDYFELQSQDDRSSVNDDIKKKIIVKYENIPNYYPMEAWFDKMINVYKEFLMIPPIN